VERIEGVDIPVLHASGWYDMFLRGHLDLYQAIAETGSERAREEQRFIVGPWDHEAYATLTPDRAGDRKFGYDAAGGTALMSDLSLQWFGYWLADEGTLDDIPPVRYYQMGDDEWRTADEWPPDHSATPYYLHSIGGANTRHGDGRLTRQRPQVQPADSYEYDPADPVPSVGGRSLHINIGDPGVKDRASVEDREDILVFTSPDLAEPLPIAGPVEVTLYASSSAPDTDFTATLVDVEPDGTCALLPKASSALDIASHGPKSRSSSRVKSMNFRSICNQSPIRLKRATGSASKSAAATSPIRPQPEHRGASCSGSIRGDAGRHAECLSHR